MLLTWWWCTILLIMVMRCMVEARKLDPLEVAIGTWDVSIRSSQSILNSELFPPRVLTSTQTTTRTFMQKERQRQQQTRHHWSIVKKKNCNHRVDCQLTIFPNQTFVLHPRSSFVQRRSDHQYYYHDSSLVNLTTDSSVLNNRIATMTTEPTGVEQEESTTIFPIRGRWAIRPNPYCVTDRFYDHLLLTSYPRVKKQLQCQLVTDNTSSKSTRDNNDPSKLEQQHTQQQKQTTNELIQVERSILRLSCRIKGHFSAIRRPFLSRYPGWYARGTMSHGVITWQVQQQQRQQQYTSREFNNKNKTTQRRNPTIVTIKASFVGKRLIPAPSLNSWYDNDEDNDTDYDSMK